MFAPNILKTLSENIDSVRSRNDALAELYVVYQYRTGAGREYATHGFLRRVRMLTHCIEKIFTFLPPDQDDIPDDDILLDATIYIQAFLINVFGALDNLAWVWVKEKGLEIENNKIGLGKKCKTVRRSFSLEMRNHLVGLEGWLENLIDFRDALAHRIPLYVPPYCVPKANLDAYENLSAQKLATQPLDAYNRIKSEQIKLVEYQPVIKHTLNDGKPPIVFHFQLLQDFLILEELGRKIMVELQITL